MEKLFCSITAALLSAAMLMGTAVSAYESEPEFEIDTDPVVGITQVFNETPISEEVVEEEVAVDEDWDWDYVYWDNTPKYSTNPELTADSANEDTIFLTWNKYKNAKSAKLYRYVESKKKYCLMKEIKEGDYAFDYCDYAATGLKSDTSYSFKIKFLNSKGKELKSDTVKASTKAAAPSLVIKRTSKKCSVIWKAKQKNATGFELYYKQDDISAYTFYWSNFTSVESLKKSGFKLLKSSSEKASGKMNIKVDKPYSLVVCSYKVVNGKKVYSALSDEKGTYQPGAWINNLKLESESVVKGNELKLVKKYVNSVVKKGMSNEEKFKAIFELVHSHGEYQNDISKIDGNRPVWQIMEKQEGQCASWAFCLDAMLEYAGFDVRVVRGTRTNGQHFWCQIKLNGKYYDVDAHLGDYLVENKGTYHDYKVVEVY